MREAEMEAKIMKAEKEAEELRQKQIYQKQYQEAWEADVKME